MNLAGYARVSTGEQAAHGESVRTQQMEQEAACYREGWRLVAVERDDGYSGREADRPGLYRALERVRDGEGEGLIVASVERLTCQMQHWFELLAWCDQVGAVIWLCDAEQDARKEPARGRAAFDVQMAQTYRERTSIKTRRGMAAKRQRGGRTGRPSLYDHPELVARFVAMRQTMSKAQICAVWNAEGIPTVRGGKRWRSSSLQVVDGYCRPEKPVRPLRLPPLA